MKRLFQSLIILLWALPSPAAEPVAEFDAALYPVKVDGEWGFINRSGEMVVEPQFVMTVNFRDGYAVVISELEPRRLMGLIDSSGEFVVPPVYDHVTFPLEGLIKVVATDGKAGYLDLEGKIALPFVYDKAGWFDSGLALVEIDGDASYINRNGEIVLESEWLECRGFRQGLAAVFDGEAWGFIDTTGELVIEPKFSSPGSFDSDGTALVEVETDLGTEHVRIDRNGEVIAVSSDTFERFMPDKFRAVSEFVEGRALAQRRNLEIVLIDENGIQLEDTGLKSGQMTGIDFENGLFRVTSMVVTGITDREFSVSWIHDLSLSKGIIDGEAGFHEGLMTFYSVSHETGGVLNSKGEILGYLEEGDFNDRHFSEGLAPFRIGSYKDGTIRWGYVDKYCNVVIEPQYLSAGLFSEGLSCVSVLPESGKEEDARTGFVDRDGKMVIPPIYEEAAGFQQGLAWVAGDTGKKVDYGGGFTRSETLGGFIDREGNAVIPLKYYGGLDFSDCRSTFVMNANDRWALINADGELLTDFIYEEVERFSEGLAAVMQDGKWGFVSPRGIMLIEPEYGIVGPFSEGLAAVVVEGRRDYVNKLGAMVIKPRFDRASPFNEGRAVVGLESVEEKGSWDFDLEKWLEYRVIDRSGRILTSRGFYKIEDYSDGYAAAQFLEEGWYRDAYLDREGNIAQASYFDSTSSFSEGMAVVGMWDVTYWIDVDGNVVWQPTY